MAPSTTVADEVLFAAAEEAYEAAQHAYIEVLRDPQNPNNDERLAQHFAGDGLEHVRTNLQLAIDGPFVARANNDNPNLIRFVLEPSFVDTRRDEIDLGVCVFLSDRLYQVGAGPNGEDVLVEDNPVSIQRIVVMKLVDGQWKSFSGGPPSEIYDEQEQCTRQ